MTKFTSYSQSGQDQWVYNHIGSRGVFLDIGCGHPIQNSNSYGLERVGWTGWIMDNNDYVATLSALSRSAKFISGDATTINWSGVVGMPASVDYLSLDVDSATLDALKRFLEHLRFRTATIEHDSYRFGNGPRDAMRRLLKDAGYTCAVQDVTSQEQPYEDWWIL